MPNSAPTTGAPARPTVGETCQRHLPRGTRQPAREHQPEHDQDRSHHPRDRVGILTQHGADPAEERAVGDEYDREAEHEQQGAETTRLRRPSRRGPFRTTR